MKIAIDIRRIQDFGIGTYIRNLVKTLTLRDFENDYLLLGDPAQAATLGELPEHFRVIPWNGSAGSLKAHWRLHHLLQANNADIFHVPYVRVMPLVPCRYLMTVHDLADFIYGHHAGIKQGLRLRMTQRALQRARRLLAVSAATKRDIENLFGIPSRQISVVENAIDERFIQSSRLEERRLVLER